MVTVLILTYNESLHIERCLKSVKSFANRIVVVDSGSTDGTQALAQKHGAELFFNKWVNYASQYNWALSMLPDDSDWILRLDADETVSTNLANEIQSQVPTLEEFVKGVSVIRHIKFMGQTIRHGGVSSLRFVRMHRYNFGKCEERWMDEHLLVNGKIVKFRGSIIDDNSKSLTWWSQKHNLYSNREVLDLLNLEYHIFPMETIGKIDIGHLANIKRIVKEKLYVKLPLGTRAMVYFFYRYVFQFGFLDGFEGSAFHILEGFWYRYLVDLKLYEVKRYMKVYNESLENAIYKVLDISLN